MQINESMKTIAFLISDKNERLTTDILLRTHDQ